MKIRKGFVSNSSSSSFCLMGIEFNPFEFELENKDSWKDCPYTDEFIEALEEEEGDYYEALGRFGLEVHSEDDGPTFVGSDDYFDLNKTGQQLVDEATSKLLKVFKVLSSDEKVSIVSGSEYC